MPVYEYLCSNGHKFDRVKGIKVSDVERQNDVCPTCDAPAEIQVSRPNPPILKGPGFHANDYGAPTKG